MTKTSIYFHFAVQQLLAHSPLLQRYHYSLPCRYVPNNNINRPDHFLSNQKYDNHLLVTLNQLEVKRVENEVFGRGACDLHATRTHSIGLFSTPLLSLSSKRYVTEPDLDSGMSICLVTLSIRKPPAYKEGIIGGEYRILHCLPSMLPLPYSSIFSSSLTQSHLTHRRHH
ncbi:hypothetical protein WAI453_000883 [Rhynchosporium graminicola]